MAFIKYILVFITSCAFATSNATIGSESRMEDLQFTYLEPSSVYVVADGKDEVDFTLKDKRGRKVENFTLYYSFNNSPYKPLNEKNLTAEEEGDFKVYAESLKRTKSIETIIHARKDLKTYINISKFASLQDLYLEDKGQKLRIKGKNSHYLKGAKYIYNGQELESFSPLQNVENANIEVYLNDSKLGDIHLKLYDIRLEIGKSELKVGNSLKDIMPRKIVDGKEENINIQELIIKNMDFSLRENVNKEELEAGTYFISVEAEINGEKIHINEREITVSYNSPFKSSQLIPLPRYLAKMNNLNFKLNDIPFLRRDKNLYVSDSMIIYKDNDRFFGFIMGDLITSSSLDVFNKENIIDSLIIEGSVEMVKLSNNIKEWPGLVNLGNTCFFNSAIKALASTAILDSQLETYYDKNIEIRSFIRALINAIRLGKESPFYLFNDKLNGAVQKELIQKTLIAISNFSIYHERVDDKRQHDCSEVIGRILAAIMIEDSIEKDTRMVSINSLSIENNSNEDKYLESKRIYNKNRATLKNLNMTQFFLKGTQTKIAEKFSFEPISYEFFKFFDLGKTSTVQDLVNVNLNNAETIEGYSIDPITLIEKNIPEDSYILGNNKKFFIDASKIRKVLEISNYFILNINRKLVNPKDPKIELKDERKILGVKEILNLPYFDYSSKTNRTIKFEPIACTVHLGGSNGGHYITYIKDKESREWYVNDDSRVKEEELTDNVGTIYTIIYEKK